MQCNLDEKQKHVDSMIVEAKAKLFDISNLKEELEAKLHTLYGAKETLDMLSQPPE